jgi:hypothetical protein
MDNKQSRETTLFWIVTLFIAGTAALLALFIW